jgi:hypothetical protein
MTDSIRKNQKQRREVSRRQILACSGAGVALVLGRSLSACAQEGEKREPLKEGDKIDVGGRAAEIVQRAYELGHQYEKEHGGCARCTVAALQDAVPFVAVDVDVFRASTCLDGGATPVNVQNCGAFTAAGMIVGHVCGSTRGENFEGSAKLAHELLHKVYYRFKDEYGTVLCRDVREGAKGDCPEVVGRAAQWVAEVLLEQFSDYQPPEPPAEKKEKETAERPPEKPGEAKAPEAKQ